MGHIYCKTFCNTRGPPVYVEIQRLIRSTIFSTPPASVKVVAWHGVYLPLQNYSVKNKSKQCHSIILPNTVHEWKTNLSVILMPQVDSTCNLSVTTPLNIPRNNPSSTFSSAAVAAKVLVRATASHTIALVCIAGSHITAAVVPAWTAFPRALFAAKLANREWCGLDRIIPKYRLSCRCSAAHCSRYRSSCHWDSRTQQPKPLRRWERRGQWWWNAWFRIREFWECHEGWKMIRTLL